MTDENPPAAPSPAPPRRALGCFAWLGLTAIAAAIIAGIILWKVFDASAWLAKRGWDLAASLPEKFQTTRITESFRESITSITPTNGDVLELAVMESDETVSSRDVKTMFNDVIMLGETVSEIRVPVVYRYHLKLTDEWKLATEGNVVTVVAPVIRPSLPPAIRTERMEKKSTSGWLRFNEAESLAALEKNLTPRLEKIGASRAKINSVRDASRKAVAKFVQQWLIKEQQWRDGGLSSIVVVFADEEAAKSTTAMRQLPATVALP
jgi:hypothetical protein